MMKKSIPMKSIRMWRIVITASILAFTLPITGCGLKGDLYLPEEESSGAAQPAEPVADDPGSDDSRTDDAEADDPQTGSEDSPEADME